MRAALLAVVALAASMLWPAAASAQDVRAFGLNAAWASPNGTPPGPAPADWLPQLETRGMNSNRIAGMTWRHFTFEGGACPAFPASGHTCNFRWTRLDDALEAHQLAGMRPTVVLADSRANSGADTKVTGSEVEVYADVMRQLTIRYTTCGTFCLIDAVQVWNEPNGAGFGGYTVEEYQTLFEATLEAVRSVEPEMRVISGSPAPTVGGWRDYQRAIAAFPGDFILGAHVYPMQEEILDTARNQYNVSRNAVDGDGNPRTVWVTETGVCTGEPTVGCWNRQTYEIDEARHAEELTRVCKMLANRGAEAIMIHTLLASHPGGVQAGTGLMNDLADEPYLRPAWDAIANCHLGWSPPANVSPPEVSGIAREGETLTASVGTWEGDGSITHTYQWLRCEGEGAEGEECEEVEGAITHEHELSAADVGRRLRAVVTAQNAWGTASAPSIPSAVVESQAPPLIAPPHSEPLPSAGDDPPPPAPVDVPSAPLPSAEPPNLSAKLEVGRALVRGAVGAAERRAGSARLVLAGSLDPRAAGERVAVRFRAAGRQIRLRPTIGTDGRFAVNRALRGAQRGARAGELRLRFAGTALLRAAHERLRAARRSVRLRIDDTRLREHRLVVVGRVLPEARGQVRIQLELNGSNGDPVQIATRAEVDRRGRYRARLAVPLAIGDRAARLTVTHPGRGPLHGQRFGLDVGGEGAADAGRAR